MGDTIAPPANVKQVYVYDLTNRRIPQYLRSRRYIRKSVCVWAFSNKPHTEYKGDTMSNLTESTIGGCSPFKLTFNLPAQKRYFDDENATKIRVLIKDSLRFQPCMVDDADTVSITPRARGGFEIMIGGPEADNVLQVLTNLLTSPPDGETVRHYRPFFLLAKQADGSLLASHYDNDGAPPKFDPHMRYWAGGASPAMSSFSTTDSAKIATADHETPSGAMMLNGLTNQIHQAFATLKDHQHNRTFGRPPRRVQEAKNLLQDVENLARTALPNLFPSMEEIKVISQASEILARMAVAAYNQNTAPISPISPIVSAKNATKSKGENSTYGLRYPSLLIRAVTYDQNGNEISDATKVVEAETTPEAVWSFADMASQSEDHDDDDPEVGNNDEDAENEATDSAVVTNDDEADSDLKLMAILAEMTGENTNASAEEGAESYQRAIAPHHQEYALSPTVRKKILPKSAKSAIHRKKIATVVSNKRIKLKRAS